MEYCGMMPSSRMLFLSPLVGGLFGCSTAILNLKHLGYSTALSTSFFIICILSLCMA